MDLRSEHPLWPLRHGLMTVVPPLGGDLGCEAVVVGAGITGSLAARRLADAGVDCAVIDARDLAQGSTAASTALLQYDIDVPLVELRDKVGPDHAERAYRAGVDAVDHLADLCATLPECAFARRSSLYLTREADDTDFLRSELHARQAAGIDCRWAERDELMGTYGLAAAGAIHSSTAAEADPYRLAHHLLRDLLGRGVPVHDRTTLLSLKEHDDAVTLTTDRGVIRARWAVMATGYESVKWLPEKVVSLHATFAVASEPMPPETAWPDRALVWEHADPYLYARWTDDHRLLFGGADVPFNNPAARDALLPRKSKALLEDFAGLWPGHPIEPAFSWAGTFGSTKDGLGYIGAPKGRDRLLFALGFGGNGITYSEIASRIIADAVRGRTHPDADLFAFGR